MPRKKQVSKLDYFEVKRARSNKWEASDATNAYDAAKNYFSSLASAPGQKVYIHTKHLYDGEVEKFCFWVEPVVRSYIVR